MGRGEKWLIGIIIFIFIAAAVINPILGLGPPKIWK